MRRFRDFSEDAPPSYQTDRLGNKVKIPHGHSFKQGSDGKGISVRPGATTHEDRFGRLHEVPKGCRAVDLPDGKVKILKPNESVSMDADENEEAPKAPDFRGKAAISKNETIKLLGELNRWLGR